MKLTSHSVGSHLRRVLGPGHVVAVSRAPHGEIYVDCSSPESAKAAAATFRQTSVRARRVRSVVRLTGRCPVCGEAATLAGRTTDGRVVGSCGDAFRRAAYEDL